jgi:trehalose synthase
MTMLDSYAPVVGNEVIDHLSQLAKPLRGKRVVHVNSTRVGGGVAEILEKLVPLMRDLEIDAQWEVITGDADFYAFTKQMHNALQGNHVEIRDAYVKCYREMNEANAERLRAQLEDADVVFIHDPQPAPLLQFMTKRRGKWIWRCHIDVSHPFRPMWKLLQPYVSSYDASIFSLAAFAQMLPHPKYLIPPSIDPLSDKNRALTVEDVMTARQRFGLDAAKPLLVQISRFDRFKDPVGVVQAYRMAKRYVHGLQLVLAGGGATDDPEGAEVLAEVQHAAADDEDIRVLLLPPDAHTTINALQRAADLVIQKSTREGFGLTVTEAMWKGKPVIGGATGGITLQVIDYHTGFLVNTPEGAALRIRYLLHQPEKIAEMGDKAREFVRENFLITRQLREYLTLMVALLHGSQERIDLV